MTVSNIVPVNNYSGNDSSITFDFDFLINSPSELVVEKTNLDGSQTTLVYNTDYSIHEIGNEEGSYITFPIDGSSYSVLGSDEKITLALELDIEQDKEYRNSSKLNLGTLENSLDYLTRIAQIQGRKIERSVKIAEGAEESTQELERKVQVVVEHIDAIEGVNANESNINAVNENKTNIDTVASIKDEVISTSSVADDIGAVANITSDIETVADISTSVSTLSDISQGVVLCAESSQDITTCATNIEDIQLACTSLVYFGEDEPSDSFKLWIDPNGESDPHFTSTLKSKLDSVESGAQVNLITSIKVNNVEQEITSKTVNITVPTKVSDLSNDSGFITNTVNDLVNYTTTADLTTLLSGKQATLVSGTNIKTINSQSLLGSGDIEISTIQNVTTLDSSGTIELADNSVNVLNATSSITFTLPTISDTTKFHQILVQLQMASPQTISLGTTNYFNKTAPDLSSAGNYNLIYEYDNNMSSWVVGVLNKGTSA